MQLYYNEGFFNEQAHTLDNDFLPKNRGRARPCTDPALIHYRKVLSLTFSPPPRCTHSQRAVLQADGRCAALSPQAVADLPNEWDLAAVKAPTTDLLQWHKEGDVIYVTTAGDNIVSANLYNTSGAELACTLQVTSPCATIVVGKLLPGIYLLRLTHDNGKNTLLKFVE